MQDGWHVHYMSIVYDAHVVPVCVWDASQRCRSIAHDVRTVWYALVRRKLVKFGGTTAVGTDMNSEPDVL